MYKQISTLNYIFIHISFYITSIFMFLLSCIYIRLIIAFYYTYPVQGYDFNKYDILYPTAESEFIHMLGSWTNI